MGSKQFSSKKIELFSVYKYVRRLSDEKKCGSVLPSTEERLSDMKSDISNISYKFLLDDVSDIMIYDDIPYSDVESHYLDVANSKNSSESQHGMLSDLRESLHDKALELAESGFWSTSTDRYLTDSERLAISEKEQVDSERRLEEALDIAINALEQEQAAEYSSDVDDGSLYSEDPAVLKQNILDAMSANGYDDVYIETPEGSVRITPCSSDFNIAHQGEIEFYLTDGPVSGLSTDNLDKLCENISNISSLVADDVHQQRMLVEFFKNNLTGFTADDYSQSHSVSKAVYEKFLDGDHVERKYTNIDDCFYDNISEIAESEGITEERCETLYNFSRDMSTFSDWYKDIYGIRPACLYAGSPDDEELSDEFSEDGPDLF